MATISETIKSINPKAKFTYINEDINTLKWLENTASINVFDIKTKKKQLEDIEQSKKDKETANKASGKLKLLKLGLTADEIKALTGV